MSSELLRACFYRKILIVRPTTRIQNSFLAVLRPSKNLGYFSSYCVSHIWSSGFFRASGSISDQLICLDFLMDRGPGLDGLSAKEREKTKSRGLNGVQLEVRARGGAPRLPV